MLFSLASNNKLKNPVKLDIQLLEAQRVSSHYNSNATIDGVWLDRIIDEKFYDRKNRIENTALMMYRDSFYIE